MPSASARRLAIAPAPRIPSLVPKTVAWQTVRCYASGGALQRTEVYERIKQLLSGFDKVGFDIFLLDADRSICSADYRHLQVLLSLLQQRVMPVVSTLP